MERTENKMVIIIRKDLNMTKGKMVSQGSHSSVNLVLNILKESNEEHKRILDEWQNDNHVKICLSVNSEKDLLSLKEQAEQLGLANSLIVDNGWTMFDGVKTITSLSILGPSEKINSITGNLKLL